MLAAIDIGNTHIVWGIFEGSTLAAHWRLATNPRTTSDEYGILCTTLLERTPHGPQPIDGTIISSVVPALTGTVVSMVKTYFGCSPLVVDANCDTGLTLKYANPREIGSDRLVNAAAAYHKFRRDLIIVDFGTATTFCAVTQAGEYLGGAIAPGLGISAEALFTRAAKLSKVELVRPPTVIGTDTASSIQSGLLFGYAGLVDTMVRRMEQEMGRTSFVVATGGLASIIAPETDTIHTIEPFLTLEGLELLYRRSQGRCPSL
ncbi:MAG: type III pantothenate kinase [Nitrospira sp.]|nr:type III pantothenate kinase [Nitrospira sp.]